ncbi:autotransporter-associated beta strand repeat family protein [Bordetella holmesii 70147]|nr:autotransporter-associated beta strand repeat family protein [Bordetella holmesii 70147]
MTPGNWTPVGPPDGSGNVVVDNGGTAVLAPGSGTYGGSTINLGSTRGTGALVVTGATLTTGGLSIGDNNTGSLTLNNATVSAGYYNVIDIGLGGNGNGLVTINGGSLISNQYLNVGSTGKGTLILNSGQVQAGTNWSVRIGEQAGSNGHVIVNGGVFRGSVGLDNFVVGRSGVGLLEVHNNGIVNTSWTFVGGEYRDGNTPTSSGGTGTIILNDDALLTSADGIVIGGQGSKGDVTANDRSRITSSVDIYVGYGGPGTLTLNGAQASATGSYYVGYTGQGVLTLDGGRASGARAIIGSQGGSTGTLRITNGGVFTIDGGTVGSATNAVGSALVSGAGSEWRVNGILYFGGNGQGTLTLQNGGKATVTSDISLGPGAGKGVVNIGSAAGQAPVAPGTVDGPSVVFGPGTAELNFNHTSANYVFSPALNSSAAGTQSVSNYAGKTTLTGGNANYQGRVNVYGGELAVDAAATTSTQNLGTGGIFIDRNGLLTLNTTGALVFTNVLTGTGTLQASNGGQSFSFGAGVGSAYAGAVKLGQNRFELGDASGANANTAALTNATLVLQAGNTTDVGQGSQAIGGLIIDGGTLNFDVTTPSASVSNSTIDTSGLLHAGRVGNVGIVLPPGVDIKNYTPTAPGTAHLFDQQKGIGGVDIKLVNSLGSLSGTGANLVLVDQSSNVITDAQVANLLQGGVLAAEATYDYRLHTGRQDDGLYAGYGLTQLNLIGTGADALLLNLSGASGLVNNLDVKVTGVGDLAVDALSGRFNVISLSGTHNDYTGVTDVRTGTLLMANPNVLGKTAELLVQGGAIADLAGYNQSVGKLTTSAGSAVHLDGATLTVTDAQRQAGDTSGGYLASNTLFGPGQLVIDPSVLAIDGQQSGFAGSVTVTGGSTVVLNTADALDTAVGTQGVAGIGVNLVTAADRLVFGDLSQRTSSAVTGFQNGATTLMIAGAGQVQVMDKADVTFLKDMTYTGGTTIGAASRLQLGNGGTTGSIIGNVANSGTLAFNRADDITFAGVISGSGGVTQDGAGTTMLSGANTYREARQIKQGVLAAGAANVFSPNSAVTVGAAGMMKLLGLPQTVGGMNNAGVVDLGGAPGTVLTVSNNYASNGGSLLTRVALGNDSSVADKVVAGSVTVDSGGATRVFVSNAGGLGALTANDGIELVHVTGERPHRRWTPLSSGRPSRQALMSTNWFSMACGMPMATGICALRWMFRSIRSTRLSRQTPIGRKCRCI